MARAGNVGGAAAMIEDVVARALSYAPWGAGQMRVAAAVTARRPRHRGTLRRRTLRTGGRFELDLGVGQEAWTYMTGAWEPATVKYIASRLSPSRTFLDVGANIGMIAIPVALRTHADVHAFEPDPENARRLRLNLALNDDARVHVLETAIGEHVGTAALAEGQDMLRRVAGAPGPIPATTIDAYAEDLPSVDLIKLDIEGNEMHAVAGAVRTLERCGPAVVCELEDAHLRACGSSAQELVETFAALGYAPVALPDVGLRTLRAHRVVEGNVCFVKRR